MWLTRRALFCMLQGHSNANLITVFEQKVALTAVASFPQGGHARAFDLAGERCRKLGASCVLLAVFFYGAIPLFRPSQCKHKPRAVIHTRTQPYIYPSAHTALSAKACKWSCWRIIAQRARNTPWIKISSGRFVSRRRLPSLKCC